MDCLDPDCAASGLCPEDDCTDGIDGDLDGFVDCEDTDCLGADGCFESDCGNEIDDDGDGLVDCEDTDCAGAGSASEKPVSLLWLPAGGAVIAPGVDCPDSNSDAASLCQAACVESDECWNGCGNN